MFARYLAAPPPPACPHVNVRRTEVRAAEVVVFVDCDDCGASLFRNGVAQ